MSALFPRILAHRDVCSRAALFVRYDGVVRGTTVIPRGYASAGVIAPVAGSPLGVALAVAGNPRYSKIDPFLAAQYAVLEAVRKVTSVGARALGLTDCLNFGNPQNVDHYSELVHSIDGLAIAANALGTPYVSGNVSLYNESRSGNAIPASPIVACVGGLEDVSRTVTAPLKRAGSALYAIGSPHNASGGAVFAELLEQTGGPLAPIDYDRATAEIALFHAANDAGLILSARSPGNGGIATALAEMAFDSAVDAIGIRLTAPQTWTGGTVGELEAAFGECCGFVVETDRPDALEAIAAEGVDVLRIGETVAAPVFSIGNADFDLRALESAFRAPLAEVYR